MESKILKVNKNRAGSGSTSSRIILPAQWVKALGIESTVKAIFDGEKIIIEVVK